MSSFRFRYTPPARRSAAALLMMACASLVAAGPGVFRNGFEALPETTVQDVQQGVATGTVYLTDRVVTARSADGKHLWIADAIAAAAFQGVYVFRGTGATVLGAEIAPGARVDVLGDVIEFDVSPPGDTLTEINNAGVVLAAATQGSPSPLAVASVGELASIADGEPYEGVLVRISNVSVMSVASGNRVTVTNGTHTIVLDDDAANFGSPAIGTCYASVTGVMHLNVFDDQRRLLPRSAADLVPGNSCN